MADLANLVLGVDSTQVDKGAKSLDNLAASGQRAQDSTKKLKQSTDETGKATEEYAADVQKLRIQMDPLYGIHVKLTEQLNKNKELFKAGAIGSQEFARANDFAHSEAEKAASAIAHVGGATSTTTRELLVMSRELGRGDFTRMAGSATILTQSLGLLKYALSPVGLAIEAVAAALGILAIAYEKGAEEERKFNNELKLTGNLAGLTASNYEAAATRIASFTDTSVRSNKQYITELANTNNFTRQQIESIVTAAEQLQNAIGVSAQNTIDEFKKMSEGPTKFAEAYADKYPNVINPIQIAHIRLLEAQGRTAEAQAEVIKAATDGIATNAEQNLGILEKGWRAATNAASDYWDMLLNIGKTPSTQSQIDDLTVKINQSARVLNAQSQGGNVNPELEATYKALINQRSALQEVANADVSAADAKAKHNTEVREGEKAIETLNSKYSSLIDSSTRYNNAVKDLDATIAKALKANPNDPTANELLKNRAAALDKLRKQYMPEEYKEDHKTDKHAEQLKRDAEAMEVAARASLDLAEAYGKSDAAALQAEAYRKAATEATRKGIDVDAQAAREIAIVVAQQAAASAKQISDLEANTAARKVANDNIADGSKTASVALRDMQDELSLRPLLTAQVLAHGKALAIITAEIEKERMALADAHKEEARTEELQVFKQEDDYIKLQTNLLGKLGDEKEAQAKIDQIAYNYYQKTGQKLDATKLENLKQEIILLREKQRAQAIKDKATDDGTQRGDDIAGEFVGARKSSLVETRKAAYKEIDKLRKQDVLSEKEAANAKRKIDGEYIEARLQGEKNFFDTLAGLSDSKNKTLRAIGKAAAIASATIDTYVAVNKALTFPPGPPATIPMAVAVGIMGAANVAKIAGLKDGGVVSGPGGPRDDKAGLFALSNGEFVVNAEATAKNRAFLEMINDGRSFQVGRKADGGIVSKTSVPVADNSNLPTFSSGGIKVEIHNHGTSKGFEIQHLSEDQIRIIARDEANKTVSTEAPKVISSHIRDPNSRVSKSLKDTTTAQRRRA